MAVIRNNVIVSPSAGPLTLAEVDGTTLEPGVYFVNAERTINGFMSSQWTVICAGTDSGTNPICYTQIWIPAVPAEPLTMYIRSRNGPGTGYTSYTTLSNQTDALVNKTSYPTEVYIQATQPTPVVGKNIVWIDTSI